MSAPSPIIHIVHWVFAVLTIGPLLIFVLSIAGTLALMGEPCGITPDAPNPCQILGIETRGMTSIMGFFAAWGALLLIPASMAFAVLWAIFALIVRRRRA